MIQKLYLLLFVLLMSVTSKAQSFTSGGILYNVTSTSPATVEVGNNGANSLLPFVGSIANIPSTVTKNFDIYAVTSIARNAFASCTGLTSVTIPNSVTNIGQTAFSNCLSLNSVTVNWASPLLINANVFASTPISSATLKVPAGTKALYQAATTWSGFGSIVEPATHLNFDGVDDYVALNHFQRPNQVSAEAWIKTSSNAQNTILGWGNDNQTFTSEFKIVGGQLAYAEFDQTTSVYQAITSNILINDNNWHHVSFTRTNGAINNVSLYIDGVINSVGTVSIITNTNQLSIGAFNFGGNQQFFNGSIDDVRIWNVARTGAQISANKNCELQGNESGLVAYYKFNQGLDAANNTDVITVNDATANANNGTLIGFAKTGTTSNFLSGSPVTTGSIIPSVAAVTTPVTYAQGATAPALTATVGANGSSLVWYTTATGGTGTTVPTPSTATVGSTSYWVSSANANGCESARTEIVVKVALPATHLNFDGANDNVTIPSAVSNAIASGSEITIEYWFKGNNLQSAVRIQNGGNYIVAGWGGSNPQFIVSTDGETNGVSNGTDAVIEDNTWHHIACVWKKNEIFATYLDGVLQNSRQAANVNLPNLAGTEGKLGSLNGGSEFMTGNLDDVRIWNVARTAAQISTNRNCELQGNETGLVAYYKFNQGLEAADNSAITTLTDATAAAYNGTLVNFTKTGSISNFLAGSPVTTGVIVPAAPSASAQTFCSATTANSLVPAISATIKWYDSATALVTTDNLTSGTYHVVAVNVNGCESERTAVSVVILENPDPETTQSFCNSATVNDLQPAPSATITWFADANATEALLVTTALVDGTTYYVQATGGTCPANPIVASTVSITSATAPTNIGGEVTDDANKNLNVIYTGTDCSYLSGLYVVNGTLNGKNVYSQLDGTRTIGYDNINNKWKLYYGTNILVSLTATNNSTANYPPASGWILEECAGTLTTETASTYNQIVCVNNNATNLIPPPSETIKWFGSATGTFSLDSNYTLSDVVYYVAGVNENGCESPRTAVTVSFLPQPAAPIVAGTPTSTSGIAVSVTGGCSNFNGNYYYRFTDNNGKNIYDNETNNTSISYDNVSQQWVLGTYVNNGVYSTDFIYPTTSTSAFPPTAGWAVANTNTVCTGVILSIGFTQIEQNYCQGATAANIAGTDPSLKIYNSNGQNIALTDVLTSGIYAVVSVGANGCESDGTMIQINIETVAPPVPAGSSISFASSQIDMTNTCPGSVALFNGTFNYNGQDANGRNKYVFADDAEVELKYLGFPYNWVISKQTNVLFKSDDISTANVPPTSGWTSTCGNVAVTVTVNDFAQSFCGNAQVNDLVATGTGTIKWYNVDTAGTALNSNDAIATGDYYVSQTNNNGCESARTTVNVTVTTLSNATTQNANVVTATENASDVTYQWYQCGTPNVLLTGETNQSYTSTANGDYYVQITKGTCVVSSVCETVLGNSNFEINSGLSIYPNPSKGIFTILSEEDSAIDLYDIIGKKVYSNKVSVGSSTIDLSNYTNGIYLLTVTNQKGNLNTFKLIKQ